MFSVSYARSQTVSFRLLTAEVRAHARTVRVAFALGQVAFGQFLLKAGRCLHVNTSLLHIHCRSRGWTVDSLMPQYGVGRLSLFLSFFLSFFLSYLNPTFIAYISNPCDYSSLCLSVPLFSFFLLFLLYLSFL
jgi:hypothetical protein